MLLLLLLSLLLLTLCARQAGTFDFILRNMRKIKREMCVKLILVDLSFALVPSMGLGTSASDHFVFRYRPRYTGHGTRDMTREVPTWEPNLFIVRCSHIKYHTNQSPSHIAREQIDIYIYVWVCVCTAESVKYQISTSPESKNATKRVCV